MKKPAIYVGDAVYAEKEKAGEVKVWTDRVEGGERVHHFIYLEPDMVSSLHNFVNGDNSRKEVADAVAQLAPGEDCSLSLAVHHTLARIKTLQDLVWRLKERARNNE